MHLNPAVQYFVRPGLAVGGTINLVHAFAFWRGEPT